MATKPQINKVKELDMVALVMHAGVTYVRGSGNIKISCPFHGPERTPSCTIYPDHYFCFGCQAHGDIISLAQEIWNVPFNEAVKILLEYKEENEL